MFHDVVDVEVHSYLSTLRTGKAGVHEHLSA